MPDSHGWTFKHEAFMSTFIVHNTGIEFVCQGHKTFDGVVCTGGSFVA